jgi:GNAT superfamily N-acetyltransferase
MATVSSANIRHASPADETAWRALWSGYCDFYGVQLPQAVTDRTWTRLRDRVDGMFCVVAEIDGQVRGFANCVVHGNTWEPLPVCYMEDLFVAPEARGGGIGRSLLQWLRDAMRPEGWARVYWMTHGENAAARALYDKFTQADGFVRYVIRQRQAPG